MFSRPSLPSGSGLALVALLTLHLSGCGFERIPVHAQRPATKIDLAKAGVTTVAVTNDASLTGANGDAAANALVDAMSAQLSARGFAVLDRTALASLLREQQLGQSGLVDSHTAAEVGRFTGAKAQIVIHLNAYGMGAETVTSETLRRIAYNASGQGYEQVYTLYTATYPVMIDASFKVLDVTTAKVIVMEKSVVAESIQLSSENRAPGRPDPSAALAKCQEKVVEAFMRAIAPYVVDEVLVFPKGSSVPGMEAGIKQARLGQWEDALREFRLAARTVDTDAKADVSDKAAVHYSLGLGLWMTGALDEAERELKGAYLLDEKTEYQDAYRRCQQAKVHEAKLRAGK